jgi:hypothetical protein
VSLKALWRFGKCVSGAPLLWVVLMYPSTHAKDVYTSPDGEGEDFSEEFLVSKMPPKTRDIERCIADMEQSNNEYVQSARIPVTPELVHEEFNNSKSILNINR